MPSTIRLAGMVLSASAALLLTGLPLDAIDVVIQGNWSKTVGALDLTAGAGSDLISVHESDAGQGVLSIGGAAASWRVDVKRSDAVWDSALHLAVRRTSDGTGSGTISGGASYLEIGTLDSTFFSGEADRTGVDLQLRFSGVSAALGVSSFSTTVTYTVVDV